MTGDRPPRWPGVHSVRFRITLVATLAVAVVLLVAGFGLLAAQRRSLTRSLEETLDSFERLCNGEGDDLPEGAFMYVGTLDDARKKAEKMKA